MRDLCPQRGITGIQAHYAYNKKEEMQKTIMAVAAAALMWAAASCDSGSDESGSAQTAPAAAPQPQVVIDPGKAPEANAKVHSLPTHIVPGRLRDIFTDSNYLQLRAAKANGFDPIVDLRSAYNLKRPIVKIHNCDAYALDPMQHSLPYLVPKAAELLHTIGKAFSDTIKARGGKAYRIRVTSLTRTDYSVSKLLKRNRNATSQSCHRYGTTFDISWIKFDCLDPSFVVSLEDLKNILAEVVYDQRQKGKCYVMFETKQGCFHITAR